MFALDYILDCFTVTAEEDDLWSSLPDTARSGQQDTLKYLQAKWAATSIRLGQLDSQLQVGTAGQPLTPG